ncbi:MAG: putative metal-binding motif-containing protein [Bacteroidetes bacterium]|nr:putative metal-binding motif-containing protein [Bacteroidota bacterium]
MWNRALTPEEVVEIYSGPDTCTTPYFSDSDNDGFGDLLLGNFCSAPPNGVLQGGDCDDANSSIHPGVNEICNGVDDNCDGIVDNGSVPTIGPILGNYQSCIPLAAGTRTFSVVPVAGVNNYAWSLPVGMNLVSGQGTPTINVSWTSSTAHTGILGNLSVVPSMDCFTGNAVSVVADLNISVPVTPPSISGASRVCVGDVITYSISSVARARQYNWTLPTGMTLLSGQGSNVISAIVDSSFTGGLLSVSGVNTCGGSPLRSKTISYNIPNTPAVIVGQTQGICDLSSVIFTTAGSFGSLGYNWIVPTGITILNGQGSNSIEVSVSNNFTNGILRVVATNNCGISNQRTISLSGNPGIPS